MPVQIYALAYRSGVSLFLGDEVDIGKLVSDTQNQRVSDGVERVEEARHQPISALPSRESLDRCLQVLASTYEISGFFNVIASSELPSGGVGSYATNAVSQDALHSGQSFVGWYGFFPSDADGRNKVYDTFVDTVGAARELTRTQS